MDRIKNIYVPEMFSGGASLVEGNESKGEEEEEERRGKKEAKVIQKMEIQGFYKRENAGKMSGK